LAGCQAEPKNLLEQAEEQFRLGAFSETVATCTAYLAEHPRDYNGLILRGRGRVSQGDYAGAIADFTAAIEIRPNEAEPYHRRESAYRNIGEPELALRDAQHARTLDPLYKTAYAYDPSNFRDKSAEPDSESEGDDEVQEQGAKESAAVASSEDQSSRSASAEPEETKIARPLTLDPAGSMGPAKGEEPIEPTLGGRSVDAGLRAEKERQVDTQGRHSTLDARPAGKTSDRSLLRPPAARPPLTTSLLASPDHPVVDPRNPGTVYVPPGGIFGPAAFGPSLPQPQAVNVPSTPRPTISTSLPAEKDPRLQAVEQSPSGLVGNPLVPPRPRATGITSGERRRP
jgi:hypothetical protein